MSEASGREEGEMVQDCLQRSWPARVTRSPSCMPRPVSLRNAKRCSLSAQLAKCNGIVISSEHFSAPPTPPLRGVVRVLALCRDHAPADNSCGFGKIGIGHALSTTAGVVCSRLAARASNAADMSVLYPIEQPIGDRAYLLFASV